MDASAGFADFAAVAFDAALSAFPSAIKLDGKSVPCVLLTPWEATGEYMDGYQASQSTATAGVNRQDYRATPRVGMPFAIDGKRGSVSSYIETSTYWQLSLIADK